MRKIYKKERKEENKVKKGVRYLGKFFDYII